MTSFQDLINASHRISASAGQFEQMTIRAATEINTNLTHLSQIAQGNRTATSAVGEVSTALRNIQASAAQLRQLQREIDNFISYISN